MEYSKERLNLVRHLESEERITSPQVAAAMTAVPRELFLPSELRAQAYQDHPLPIGQGQTMSAPHMVALMSETLDLAPGLKVLEVGTGSGYHAAVTARLVSPGGHVVTLEWVAELADRARENLRAAGVENVDVLNGDGSLGHPPGAPYDRIYLTCAAPRVPPPLLEQLRDPGILLAPVGRDPSQLVRIRRQGGSYDPEDLGPCSFVPMMGEFSEHR